MVILYGVFSSNYIFVAHLHASGADPCPICLNDSDKPTATRCCGQKFCSSCLEQALCVSPYCPTCRTPLRQIIGNQPPGTMTTSVSHHIPSNFLSLSPPSLYPSPFLPPSFSLPPSPLLPSFLPPFLAPPPLPPSSFLPPITS